MTSKLLSLYLVLLQVASSQVARNHSSPPPKKKRGKKHNHRRIQTSTLIGIDETFSCALAITITCLQLLGMDVKKNILSRPASVDGRHPKQPPGMYKTLQIMGYSPYQLVQDFFHQPYVHEKNMNVSIQILPCVSLIRTYHVASFHQPKIDIFFGEYRIPLIKHHETTPFWGWLHTRGKNGFALFPLSHLPIFTASFTVKHVNKRILARSNWINVNWLSYLTTSEFVLGISRTLLRCKRCVLDPVHHVCRDTSFVLSTMTWHIETLKDGSNLKTYSAPNIIGWKYFNPLRCSLFHVLKTWNSNKSWEFIEPIYKSLAHFLIFHLDQVTLERTDLKATTAADFKVSSRELPSSSVARFGVRHSGKTPNF